MGYLKVWNGSSFVLAKAVKVWDGTAWVNRILQHYDGTKWVDDTTKTYTFTANMTDSVSEAYGSWRTSNDRPYQSAWDDGMQNVGFIWFNPSDFANLSGKIIVKTELYLYRQSGSGYSPEKGVHVWGTSMQSSARSGTKTLAQAIATLSNQSADAMSLAWGVEGWGPISNAVAEGMRDGTRYGVGLYSSSGSMNDYMIFDAYNEGHPPKIKITCY